jgi:hypothetical protein
LAFPKDINNWLALMWQTLIKQSDDGVLGYPLFEKCGIGKPILHA